MAATSFGAVVSGEIGGKLNDFEKICGEIRQERERQIDKWGDDIRTPQTMLIVIGEEFGEACMAFNDDDSDNYRVELIQIAACCVKAIQSFDRQKSEALASTKT